MQVLIELPQWSEMEALGGPEKALFRPVCGVPLLARIIKTAIRNEKATSFFMARPPELPRGWLKKRLRSCLAPDLVDRLLIIENDKNRTLAAIFEKHHACRLWNDIAGVQVDSDQSAARAEREMVRGSGKSTDGIFSRFNRRLCRPAVLLLCRTSITPNMISFAGLIICFMSALSFSLGHWSAYAMGGILFFLAGLCDEMDGMLARLIFKESAFGCWFESFADQAGYVLVFGGMTVGLWRQMGTLWAVLGGLFIFGCLISVLITSSQRKRATAADRPQEFLANYYRAMEADSGNWISKRARQVQFLMKKSAIMHEILFFSLLGLLPLLLASGALAANLVWILALYFDKRFFRPKETVLRLTEANGTRAA